MCNLGVCYENGWGVPKDFNQAAAWYRKAADRGNAPAQCNLGAAYFMGRGVPKDPAQAETWLRKAADQGHTMARQYLENLRTSGHL